MLEFNFLAVDTLKKVMKLFNTEIIQEILQLMQFETIPEIKCAAIGALTALGVNSEEIVHALAWAVRFEDAPTCRFQAANAILNLKLFHDKNVVETVRERTVVEDDPEVQAVLVDILKESSVHSFSVYMIASGREKIYEHKKGIEFDRGPSIGTASIID